MLSINQFEQENRNEISVLLDRLTGYHDSLFEKLDYRRLVSFLYYHYRS
jgi:hypothetical protein